MEGRGGREKVKFVKSYIRVVEHNEKVLRQIRCESIVFEISSPINLTPSSLQRINLVLEHCLVMATYFTLN